MAASSPSALSIASPLPSSPVGAVSLSSSSHQRTSHVNKSGINGRAIDGVIFDMDGTLTRPGLINFKRMTQRLRKLREERPASLPTATVDAINAVTTSSSSSTTSSSSASLPPNFYELDIIAQLMLW
jgi:hypothetical protein